MNTFSTLKVIPIGTLATLCMLATPLQADAKNNGAKNASSCSGLLNALLNTPPNSVAREKLLAKVYERGCGEDPDQDTLYSFEEILVHLTDPLNPDTDADGLSDGDEVNYYPTDPLVADTDADGLDDGDEVFAYFTDPVIADSDADGLLDGEEVTLYATDPLNPDSDDDTLSDGDEVLTYLTDPLNPDTDTDGLSDADEIYNYPTDPLVADTDADGLNDGDEVFVHSTDPIVADTDADWLLDGEEVTIYNTDPLNSDSDDDTLSDGDEVLTYLTDPLNQDTDEDMLPDGWEVNGHPNGTLLVDANPRHADIYVEMDYMTRASAANGLGPNANVITGIIEVFNNAPNTNPDGTTGIHIHLDLDDEVPYDNDLTPYETEILAIKDAYFDDLRLPIYHYMIWVNGYNGGSSSGVSLGIPASDFIVSLGLWNSSNGGTDEQKIGTFIHELGHNLGLKHGGSDHNNYKPNYISVMNYLFQTVGISTPNGIQFDYQRFDTPAIDEANLSEPFGLNAGPQWDGYSTFYHCINTNIRRSSAVAPIDWNCDGFATDMVAGDVNRDNSMSVLMAQNNWQNIDFGGDGVIGLGVRSQQLLRTVQQPLEEELTWEQHLMLTETQR